jgi:transposase, IS30 family
MSYRQVAPEERYTLAVLRRQDSSVSCAALGRVLGRHRSTISREFKRNSARLDGRYRAAKAQERTNGRRSRSRRNSQFSAEDWQLVDALLREDFSPEQISGRLRSDGTLRISHETIYQHILRDKASGGDLHRCLRQRVKRRKRYGATDRRGRLLGKRNISERPVAAESRSEPGHGEIDTVMGSGSKDCVVTVVDRATGLLLVGKLADRTAASVNQRVISLLRQWPGLFKTMTADNGTEFHGYEDIERATGVDFYFANPYHSWERGTNENTNGLLRQYLPKRMSMRDLTQRQCTLLANKLNCRPRKRYGYDTPFERLETLLST